MALQQYYCELANQEFYDPNEGSYYEMEEVKEDEIHVIKLTGLDISCSPVDLMIVTQAKGYFQCVLTPLIVVMEFSPLMIQLISAILNTCLTI
uniref:FERM domain-containing protein n=1 Tax=Rhabditophanes sp. KR3021 TaxID=114890 RepID=A0AC35UFR0_9BILA